MACAIEGPAGARGPSASSRSSSSWYFSSAFAYVAGASSLRSLHSRRGPRCQHFGAVADGSSILKQQLLVIFYRVCVRGRCQQLEVTKPDGHKYR
jgi:hypothetical protein